VGILPGLLDIFSKQSIKENKLRVHLDDPLAVHKLSRQLSDFLSCSVKKEKPIILCIGTDRSTGDSLGPLTGWRLTSLLHDTGIEVFGTVDNPLHAQNLVQNLSAISEKTSRHPVIAVDACLGQHTNVGTVLLVQEALKPGSGVCKELPPVGDISISGIVNVGGFMELQVLQNTRLSLVLKMSQIIANSIYLAVNKNNKLETAKGAL